jgi:hypothetical protein
MIAQDGIIRQLKANAEIIRALCISLSNQQAVWQPDDQTWSVKDVIEHLYNEERFDFRRHLEEILHDPQQLWSDIPQDRIISIPNFWQGLELFFEEREDSLAWLAALDSPDWDRISIVKLGSQGEEFRITAGAVLASWVAHDFLHIRQINELHYTWFTAQSHPYSVTYAGKW